jgi:hypothetical protein
MPAIYAHDTFGRRVSAKLDGEVKDVINRYKKYYRLGLFGPDFLYFYRPYYKNDVNRRGFRTHEEPMSKFMSHARDIVELKGRNSPECAYVLGVICHFMLDSACHPYVYRAIEETGVDHVELETEFERHMLKSDNKDPLSFPLVGFIPCDLETAMHIRELYPGISAAEIREALIELKLIKGFMICPGDMKRKIVTGFMKCSGIYQYAKGHMFNKEENAACEESNRELLKLYYKEILPAAEIIREFFYSDPEDKLNERFNFTFGGM